MEREGREAKLRGRRKSWLGRDYFSATGENRSRLARRLLFQGKHSSRVSLSRVPNRVGHRPLPRVRAFRAPRRTGSVT